MDEEESGLKLIPIAIISNVTHERNIAYQCNQKVIQMVQSKLNQVINTVHIWSDGCASQFRSQYVLRTLSFYPASSKVFCDYGEAHHFQGYLHYKTITSQNVQSKAQINNFFIS